ncbi:MAG: alcohol dehydrogenase catalytic domain-containing protein [Thermomicrobiales bacterium]|nr:alcohol dehydrogenase catalytic domain-containing protein [Thermomicrobiales bacterium]
MKAAVFAGEGKVTIEDRAAPRVERNDDVIVEVAANGLCGSDLRAFETPPQMIYKNGVVVGHEFSGTVSDVGEEVTAFAEGDRVVAAPAINCQTCWYCQSGHVNLCENFTHLGGMVDGGAAEFARLPERAVLRIPDSVPDDLATLTEPLACVLNGTRRAAVHPGETVLVLGSGPIGLLYLLMFKAAGATVIVSEPAAHRAATAAEYGADYVIDPAAKDVAEAVREILPRGVDLAVDTVGLLLVAAMNSVRKGGRVLVFGLNDLALAEVGEAAISYGELQIEGVYIAKGTFPLALQLLERNEFGFDRLITHRLELDRFWDAVELSRRGEAVKALVVP